MKIGINLNSDSDESEDDVKDYEPDEMITDYLPEDTLIIIDEPEITINEIKDKDLITSLENSGTFILLLLRIHYLN